MQPETFPSGLDIKQQPQQKLNHEVHKPRVKSELHIILIGLIISLSAFMLGYSMKEITSVPKETLVKKYDITQMGAFEAQSLLIGILPVGSVVGVILSVNLIKKFRRLTGIYIFTIINVGAMVLINQLFFVTLVLGRFIEGICIGFYAYLAPAYLKEIAPKEMRRLLGLFFSLGKIVGVMFVIILEIILDKSKVEIAFRIILSMTGVVSVLQSILIFFFGSDTITEKLEKDDREGALQIIDEFYPKQNAQEILNQYIQEYKADMHQGEEDTEIEQLAGKNQNQKVSSLNVLEIVLQVKSGPPQQLKPKQQPTRQISLNFGQQDKDELTFTQKKFRAYLMAVQMCALRQFCGGNVLLVQGGQFVKTINPTLGYYTPIIINSVQFLFILIGIFYIQKIMGKRPLFMFSIPMMIILNFAIVVSMAFQQLLATMILMSVFMMVFGGSFININWAIPPELAPARELLIPNIVHWLTLAFANLIPPLVSNAMPKNNPYPVFFFFAIYNIFAYIHIRNCLRETDGKTYMEIVKSFH